VIKMQPRQSVASYGARGATVSVVSLVRRGERHTVVFWREGGKRREQTIAGATKREQEAAARAFAQAKHTALRLAQGGVEVVLQAPLSVGELHEKYLKAEGAQWAPATKRNHGARWQKFVDFAGRHTPAADVDAESLDDFQVALRRLGHRESEILRHVTCVKSVFRWGVQRDLPGLERSKVPIYKAKILPGSRRQRIDEFNTAETRAVLAELRPRGPKVGRGGLVRPWRPWAICWLTAASAKRTRSQMLPLRWDDVLFVRGGASIEWPSETDKLRKEHRQPMPRRAAALLRLVRWLARQEGQVSPYVFPAPIDKRRNRQIPHYSYTALVAALHSGSERAGVVHKAGRAMHGFRRYAANTVLESGGSIKDAGLWLNDDDLKTLTESYLRERKGEQEAIARRMPSPDGRAKRGKA
jgi:integrase